MSNIWVFIVIEKNLANEFDLEVLCKGFVDRGRIPQRETKSKSFHGAGTSVPTPVMILWREITINKVRIFRLLFCT